MNKLFREIYLDFLKEREQEGTSNKIVALEKMLDHFYEYFEREKINPSHAREWVKEGSLEIEIVIDEEKKIFLVYDEDFLKTGDLTHEQFNNEEFMDRFIPDKYQVQNVIDQKQPFQTFHVWEF